MAGQVLVVDDDRELCELIVDGLHRRDFDAVPAYDEAGALEALRANAYDVVALDVQLGRDDGIGLCSHIIENNPGTHVILMTGHADLHTAISAIRAGAYDFITKPLTVDGLVMSLQRAIEHRDLTAEVRRLREASRGSHGRGDLIGESSAIRALRNLIQQVAAGDTPILITGERGAGKTLAGREIHRLSPRSLGPLVVFDCAAAAPSVVERELLGDPPTGDHGSADRRISPLLQATGGTLLLLEAGELPPAVQDRLLRALQRGELPAPDGRRAAFDTRVLATTSRDVEASLERGELGEDFYFHVNVVRVDVPPLRSRGRDILILAQHFLTAAAADANKEIRGFTRATAEKLLGYDWPGNVRELRNCVDHAVALTRFDEITPADFPEKVATHRRSRIVISGDDPDEMPTLEEVELRYVGHVMEAVRHNKLHAARVLGIHQRALYHKLERLNRPPTGD